MQTAERAHVLFQPDENGERFELDVFHPEDQGLPMTVWVRVGVDLSKGIWLDDEPCIGVCPHHGRSRDTTDIAVLSIAEPERRLCGELTTADHQAVAAWVNKYRDALQRYWAHELSTMELIDSICPETKKPGSPLSRG